MEATEVSLDLLENGHAKSRANSIKKRSRAAEKKSINQNPMYYTVNENPPWFAAILLGLQQVMVCISGVISMPAVCLDAICGEGNTEARMLLISTMLVVTGIGTILQTTLGLRLPMLQGPAAAFVPPIIGLMAIKRFECPTDPEEMRMAWMDRIVYLQGGQIVASLFQMVLGGTGLIGIVTKLIGPLTIAPLMILLELSLVQLILHYILLHWISVVTIGLLFLFSLYLADVNVPVPTYDSSQRRWLKSQEPLFSLFPYVLSIGIAWILCIILTYTGAFNHTTDIAARVDGNSSSIIGESPWIRFPYPGQWGAPRVSIAVVIGMIAATICSVLESVGDYHACARVACEPRTPMHAVNRGILMEGFSCFIGGFLGGGLSVTSYSEIIGAIGITKVASRVTMQIAGFIMILMGLFTKFGAILATMPEPLFGGTLYLSMSMVMGVGISSLKQADMSLSRNMAIVGAAVLTGLLVPEVVRHRPIDSGITTLDDTITMFCSMPLIIGGLMGFVLDNTVPGATRQQRGLHHDEFAQDEEGASDAGLREDAATSDLGQSDATYAFPPRVMQFLRAVPFARFLPFLPPLQEA